MAFYGVFKSVVAIVIQSVFYLKCFSFKNTSK